ncbi:MULTISPECIES: nuclear transport factor 2 family protein [Variovorax]|uniref:nuclear transport factor 2 family protein n=1 Tax=Variovorax TaxID=34072 RepID=UPI002577ED12|nr:MULTISPECIES: nuclear transport factor 2 family protein [unclassified Variovorax]MDM0042326.1 nuclear transport factor 2 family protein [Variovorax sp. J22R193]MDM0060930.1 nuclear transport factor 2 family protein [Variovorax sp. J22G21]MDM0122124.1 nuclear transport factor 2 family protein [Variovorax sp. J2L1-78]MDM0131347.1 nuclear transport factor 2 family protein [Variovorax sp. J2L1-63]MDM0234886.1 nuclear transport factor 2 family protein [Variovorax sp. J2R1-6]
MPLHIQSSPRRAFHQGALVLAAAPLAILSGEAAAAYASTETVLKHHLGAFAKGLDEIMQDYSDSSILLTHDKKYHGKEEIRGFFDGFLKSVKPGFWEAFKINAQAIDGDVAYLVWEAKPFVNIATDTLVVRKGKIAAQTFTAG